MPRRTITLPALTLLLAALLTGCSTQPPASTGDPAATPATPTKAAPSPSPSVALTPGAWFPGGPLWVAPRVPASPLPVVVDGTLLTAGEPQTVTARRVDGSEAWTFTTPDASPVTVRVLDKTTVALVAQVQAPGSGASRASWSSTVQVSRAATGEVAKEVTVPAGDQPANPASEAGLVLPGATADAPVTVVAADGSTRNVSPVTLDLPTSAGLFPVRSVPSYAVEPVVVHEWTIPENTANAAVDAFGTDAWNSLTTHPAGADPGTGQVVAAAATGLLVGAWQAKDQPGTALVAAVDPGTGKAVGQALACPGATVPQTPAGVAMSPDGRYVAVTGVAALDATSGKGVCLAPTSAAVEVKATAVGDDGMAYGLADGKPVAVDLTKDQPQIVDLPGAQDAPVAVLGDTAVFRTADDRQLAAYRRTR